MTSSQRNQKRIEQLKSENEQLADHDSKLTQLLGQYKERIQGKDQLENEKALEINTDNDSLNFKYDNLVSSHLENQKQVTVQQSLDTSKVVSGP